MRESEIENKVCQYAKSLGWLCYKFSSPGNRGVPDHLLLRNQVTLFIEFKAPNKKLTKLQQKIFKRIGSQTDNIYVIDNIEDGKNLINKLERR